MTLLAILLGLGIEKMLPNLLVYRRYDWFYEYQLWMREKLSSINGWTETLSLVSVIVVPVIVVAIFHHYLFESLPIFSFVFSVIVLAYCVGPEDIFDVAQQFGNIMDDQDNAKVRSLAASFINAPLPESDEGLCTAVKEKLLIATNSSVLAILFWFAILGPMGAFLYRLTTIAYEAKEQPSKDNDQAGKNAEYRNTAAMLFSILNWLPAHMTALCFAVAGNFVDALHHWKENKIENHISNDECESMLINVGLGALQHRNQLATDSPSTIAEVVSLAKRSIILWLTVLALLSMSGWAG